MTPPLTSGPTAAESVTAIKFTSTQVFGVMYITLTVLIDSTVWCGGHDTKEQAELPYCPSASRLGMRPVGEKERCSKQTIKEQAVLHSYSLFTSTTLYAFLVCGCLKAMNNGNMLICFNQ
ncbi:hypothetical protein DSO57_1038909 [Entomophthora muscae]|uniref:Uncharacterized protein n=1 Tax=Entomophthora muscae TaxID=34485 RepID=A0ACC2T9D8_9FUNG|nr:hypothetical protein DSO57_1038909 [Entomophthora muscae]